MFFISFHSYSYVFFFQRFYCNKPGQQLYKQCKRKSRLKRMCFCGHRYDKRSTTYANYYCIPPPSLSLSLSCSVCLSVCLLCFIVIESCSCAGIQHIIDIFVRCGLHTLSKTTHSTACSRLSFKCQSKNTFTFVGHVQHARKRNFVGQ